MAFYLAKYGTQTDIRFPMVKRGVVDLAVTGDWTPATGDTKVSKDGGAQANTTNNPAIVSGVSWKLTLTATELTAAEVNVMIVDSATKAVEDQFLTVYTYGNASAKIPIDLSDTVRAGLTALPNAAAAASGGLFVRGTGAGAINQDANGRIDVNVEAWNATAVVTGRLSTAQSGSTSSTIKLDTSASAVDSTYNGMWVSIVNGTGAGQMREITAYVGATKVATIAPNWGTTPDNTSIFAITEKPR